MPLTRHFYALDEVQAALGHTVMRYDPKEALYWCHELVTSGMGMHAISTLTETWLWQKGPFRMQWLLSAWRLLGASDECTEENVFQVCDQLRSTYRIVDHSLWNMMIGQRSLLQPDTLCLHEKDHCHYGENITDDSLQFLVRACRQRKATLAWWFLEQHEREQGWNWIKHAIEHVLPASWHAVYQECIIAAQSYEQLIGFQSVTYDRAFQLLLLLSLCLTPSQRKASFAPLPAEMDGAAEQMLRTLPIGRMAARCYTIPTACLYGITERGRMRWTEHTRGMMYRIEEHLVGCAYWEEAIAPYCDGPYTQEQPIPWKDEDAMEAFYQQYFPDDIPDEWTREELQRSHGEGVLAPTEQISAAKFSRLYAGKYARLAWTLPAYVQTYLAEQVIVFDSVTSLVDALYVVPSTTTRFAVDLKPKKRVRIIRG